MANVLLIDDEASYGWQEILEKVFFSGDKITVASTEAEAIKCVNQKRYELIFLDLRIGESDHHVKDLKSFRSYQILVRDIRESFERKNFATPVILFTASNKIWNINAMLEAGADDFCIKEHPDQATDTDFSFQNFRRLKHQTQELPRLGRRRNAALDKVNLILKQLSTEINDQNIRDRIAEKLKIGYTTLFHRHSRFESEKFSFSQELMAYICFWSILEEIVKDYFLDNWIKSGPKEGEMIDGNWTLRNGKKFIERSIVKAPGKNSTQLEVRIILQSGTYRQVTRIIKERDKNFHHYQGKIYLSLQVMALLLLGKGWPVVKANQRFNELNQFRNRVDFIHSSVDSIFNKPLSTATDKEEAEGFCLKMLDFIRELLASPWIT